MVRVFPRAGRNIKLPQFAWRLLCADDCTDECQTSCRGCRELVALAEDLQEQAAGPVVGAGRASGSAADREPIA